MKILKYILFISISLNLVSCSDYIDNEITGKQNLDTYYSNYSECNKAVIGCYASLSPQDWWETDFFWMVGDICSDDAFKGNSIEGDQRDFGNLADFNITSSNEWLDSKWRYTYQGIFRCNLAIARIPEAPISDEEITMFVAEAKFLRAFFYFELVKNWGSVPLLTEAISVSEANLEKSSEDEIWYQIEKDLTEAKDNLPSKSELSATDKGRATKGAAIAYLAKAALYQKKYTEAQSFANDVIISGEYNLNDSFENVWSVANPNGNGSVFEIQNSYNELYDTGNALPVLSRSRADGGWGFCTPSSNLDNFMAGDPRREFTIINQGDYVDEDHPSYDTKPSENMSGRINRKYYLSMADRPDKSASKRSPLNHILIRYADLLLMHAEAAYYNGDDNAALISLNKVRARVGLDEVVSTGQGLINAIFNERRMELAMEGNRYYDLKRSDRLSDAIAAFMNYNVNESTDEYDAGNDEGKYYKAAVHSLFPIPLSEINLSQGRITQNPGY